ncbi:MAG: glycosyltransferase N-terminal domain-containing protein [Candidatus Cloacimonetes bacterium]|nr:glycosyltransferase N-terminal domain-containing protein [Candidatus Cloacimonadota bacterium]
MIAILTLFNLLLEAVYILFFPVIYIILNALKYLPSIFVRGNDTNKGILFHAASVGEVNAIKPLVTKLLDEDRALQIVITTSTITGLQLAQSISPLVQAYLSAVDVPHIRNKQLDKINPSLICIVETEIWLNMLYWAKRHKVQVLFINARMSERTFKWYHKLRNILRFVGSSIEGIYAQSEENALRYRQIFNCPVINSGNLKYSLKLKDYNQNDIRKELGFKEEDFILCWGSSRPGEEALILSMLPALTTKIPKLKLIIAIRHTNRLKEVLALLQNLHYRLYSKGILEDNIDTKVLVIDTLGVLDKAYAICDVAIVGGSFYDFGGHNPLEPAFYAKPIIIGNFHRSCKDSVKKLQEGNGIVVSDGSKLNPDIISLAKDEAKRNSLGTHAKQILNENSQALDEQMQTIINTMEIRK